MPGSPARSPVLPPERTSRHRMSSVQIPEPSPRLPALSSLSSVLIVVHSLDDLKPPGDETCLVARSLRPTLTRTSSVPIQTADAKPSHADSLTSCRRKVMTDSGASPNPHFQR